MATTLSTYQPGAAAVSTFHTWERTDRHGVTIEHSYRLDHADPQCPDALAAEGIGTGWTAREATEGWPCPTCIPIDTKADTRPNGDRRDSIDAPDRTASAGPARTAEGPTDKQLAYLTALLRSAVTNADLTAAEREQVCITTAQAHRTKRAASESIDSLVEAGHRPVWSALVDPEPVAAPVVARPTRTNRYAATCASCGRQVPAETGELTKGTSGWEVRHVGGCTTPTAPEVGGLDLTDLPDGRYGVPGGDTRLKIRVTRPTEGRWTGYVFVSDAAEYGHGQRYGRQAPGGTYSGQVQDELVAVMADTRGALKRYAELTGRCGHCGRKLEDEQSVKRGVGPVCFSKLGWA